MMSVTRSEVDDADGADRAGVEDGGSGEVLATDITDRHG